MPKNKETPTEKASIEQTIAKPKESEDILKKSEYLRTIIENSRDGINLLDLKTGKYVFMNSAQIKLTGFTFEEINNISAKEAYERTHPDDRRITMEQQKKVAAGEDASEPVEYRWRVKSGEYRWFSDSRKLVRDEKGQPIALVGISRDITEHKRAEESLKASEERFRIALKNAPVSVAAQDRQLRYIWAYNQKTARPDQIIGKLDSEIFTPEESAHLEVIKRQVLKEGIELREQKWYNRPSSPIFLDVTWSPLHDSKGQIIGVSSTTVDLTYMKITEGSLKQSEQRYRQLFNSITDMFSAVDFSYFVMELIHDKNGEPVDGIYREVNPATERLIGKTREQLIGKSRKELFGQNINDEFPEKFDIVAKTGKPTHFENYGAALQRFYDVYVWKVAENQVGVILTDITERKKAQEALRLSEERFSKAFNLSPFAVIMTRLNDGTYVDVNDTFLKMFGYSRNEVIGHTANEIKIYANPNGRAAYLAAFKNGRVSDFEVDLKTKTGKPLKALGYAEIINIDGQDLTIGTLVDITERKKAEEALTKKQAELQTILDSSQGWVFYKDLENHFVRVNKAFAEIMGLPKEQLEGRSLFELYPKEEAEAFWNDDKQVIASGKAKVGIEEKMQSKQGQRWVQTDKIPYRDAGGNIIGVIGFSEDITERKKSEEALNKLNEELEERVLKRTEEVSNERRRLYNVLETLPTYVILLDKDYRVPFANKIFRETFGESHGRRCHEYLFGRDSECENCETYKVLKNNKPQHWEWTGPNKHDYEIYDYPFVEADGSTLILEMGIDVTERKKAEREALESAKKLKDAERLAAIGATAGMVGHDIRNPLQGMTSDVYLAKTELASLPESEEKKNALESLDEIQKNIDYVNKIVADLQDYARPLNPRAQETSIKSVFNEIFAKNGIPKNIELTVEVEAKAEKIMADPDYLKRIAANLTLNAVQAMPEGGKLTIHAYTDKQTNDVLITVKDTGVGIPEDIKPKLFTPMMTTKSKGQGFGLAVVKRMTEGLGGTVTFESTEGKGTTFTVRLPPPKR